MKKLITRFIFNEKVEYLFWGVATTLVYFVTRFATMAMTSSSMLPVTIAQIISIGFAFVVNKYLVFNGRQTKNVPVQFMIFITGRAIAAALDFLLTYLMIDRFASFFIHLFFIQHVNYRSFIFTFGPVKNLMGSPVLLNSFITVILIQVIIIIINFIVSKYFAFK